MRRQRRLKNEINVVPYIDVMLVLLVIFMVTAPTIQLGEINLPSAGSAATPQVKQNPIYVIVQAKGKIELRDAAGSSVVSGKDLPFRIKAMRGANEERFVTVAADKNIDYQSVIDVLATLNDAGIRNVGISVQEGKPIR